MSNIKHPDHEFLYEVGSTAEGKTIYTSDFWIKKATVLPDKGIELDQPACIQIPDDSPDSEH